MTNLNPTIKARSEEWDARMTEVIDLIVHLNYRVKDLADHFDCKQDAIRSVLNRRGLSVIRLKHDYANGKDVYNWRNS